ncbi:hypothetical protein C8Q80DRAFT_317774 [Daedaleopsis nitida]|nr:hypothetical protein C8Q80DRAFT_317774 [Daedaleopsis nitida]
MRSDAALMLLLPAALRASLSPVDVFDDFDRMSPGRMLQVCRRFSPRRACTTPAHTPPAHTPRYIAEDVEKAVLWAIEQEMKQG